MKKKLIAGASVAAVSTGSVMAQATAPINMTQTGTDIAGFIAGAAGAGLAVMAGLYGLRIIIRAFKSVR